MIFQNGRSGYRSAMRNGFRSEGKSKSDVTVTFEGYVTVEEIVLNPGSKIDVKNPVGAGWVAGVIMEVDTKDTSSKVLKVNIEGVSGAPMILNYPDPTKITPCGDNVKDRNCKGSRNGINKKKPLKFRFMPPDYTEEGDYIPDNGKKFGEPGKAYGWSRDMGAHMKQFNEASKQYLHSYAEFLPPSKAKACSVPGANCESVNWSAKVGDGLFFVRIYAGDATSKSRINLQVNGKYFAKDQHVAEDEIKVFEGVAESSNGFIVITQKCEEKCDHGSSKMNAVEIMPYEDKPKAKESKTPEKEVCGHSYVGGRCEKGPNVMHCLFDDPSEEVAGNCTGSLVIMNIPNTYTCKDQIGKFKCVKKIYDTDDECKKYCVNNCNRNQCIS